MRTADWETIAREEMSKRISLEDEVAALKQRALEAVAVRGGWQEGYGDVPGFEVWHLKRDFGGYPAGSTLSRKTIEKLIFQSQDADFRAVEKP